jgi:hypothetical protein
VCCTAVSLAQSATKKGVWPTPEDEWQGGQGEEGGRVAGWIWPVRSGCVRFV